MADEQRPRVSRAEWAKRVERWQDSGLTATEFAREMNINPGTLRQWKYQFEGERRGTRPVPRADKGRRASETTGAGEQRPRSNGFVELSTSVAVARSFEIAVGAYRLMVPRGFDEAELGKLLRVVDSLR